MGVTLKVKVCMPALACRDRKNDDYLFTYDIYIRDDEASYSMSFLLHVCIRQFEDKLD